MGNKAVTNRPSTAAPQSMIPEATDAQLKGKVFVVYDERSRTMKAAFSNLEDAQVAIGDADTHAIQPVRLNPGLETGGTE